MDMRNDYLEKMSATQIKTIMTTSFRDRKQRNSPVTHQ